MLERIKFMSKWFISKDEEEYMKLTGKPVIKTMYWWPTRTWVIAKAINIGRPYHEIDVDPDRHLRYEVELAPSSVFNRYLCYKQLLSGPKTARQMADHLGLATDSILNLLSNTPECFERCGKGNGGIVWRIREDVDSENIPWIYNTDLSEDMSFEE